MSEPIALIVGLGNPGPEYALTRHNAGEWLIDAIARDNNTSCRLEKKFHGLVASATVNSHKLRLLIPTTFMNRSGLAVKSIAQFYKIPPQAICVAHDDLDLAPGRVQVKQGGGHGGHNGLRDIISHLGTNDFVRLRLGIGHPRVRDQVHNYVLSQPSKAEREQIEGALTRTLNQLPALLAGDLQKAMRELHVRNK